MQLTLAGALLVGLGGAAAGAVAAWSLRNGWHRQGQDRARLSLRSLRSVPAVVAGGWVLVAANVVDNAAIPAVLLFVVLAAALAWIDLDVHRLPDLLMLGGAVAVTALLAVAAATTDRWHQLGVAAVTAVLLTVVFLGLAVFGSMGLGDVKLAGLVGLVLGWFGFQTVLTGMVVAFGGAPRPMVHPHRVRSGPGPGSGGGPDRYALQRLNGLCSLEQTPRSLIGKVRSGREQLQVCQVS